MPDRQKLRTSVGTIEKYDASHRKTSLNAEVIDVRRPWRAKRADDASPRLADVGLLTELICLGAPPSTRYRFAWNAGVAEW